MFLIKIIDRNQEKNIKPHKIKLCINIQLCIQLSYVLIYEEKSREKQYVILKLIPGY